MKTISMRATICSFMVMVFAQALWSASTLNRSKIQEMFNKGQFKEAEEFLNQYLDNNEKNITKSEKVFCFSVLSAIHGNSDSTLEKARVYMWSLVELEPNPKIEKLLTHKKGLDLYQRVRTAFFQGDESVLSKDLESVLGQETKKEDGSNWVWYSLGGVGVVAAATSLFLISTGDPETVVYKGTVE